MSFVVWFMALFLIASHTDIALPSIVTAIVVALYALKGVSEK